MTKTTIPTSTPLKADAGSFLSDDQFRRFAASLSTVIWRLSASGAQIIAPRWAELAGKRDHELQNNGWLDTIHPDDRAQFVSELRSALAYGTHLQTDVRLRMRDGSYHWFRSRGEPMRNDRGLIAGWVGVSHSIDDQKRTELAMAENEQRELADRALMSAIVESSDDAIVAVSLDATITHWNPAAERIFGYSSAEIVGASLLRIVPEDDVHTIRRRLAAVVSGKRVEPYVARRVTKAGAFVDLSVKVSAIHDSGGRIYGASLIMRNITQQRRLEAEVAESQKMEAVGRLASGVSHDLNNVLTAILAELEIAETSPALDTATRKSFREVRMSCFDAARLLRQLLAVARRQPISPSVCSVHVAVEEVLPILGRIASENVTIATSLEATAGAVIDVQYFGQVLMNLVANSRDAMPEGGQIEILTRDDPETNSVLTIVRDTGPGIAPDIQARVFEPFFSTKGAVGSGLGLSTAYGIIAQLGGSITLDSALGFGAAFTIRLPAVTEPAIDVRAARMIRQERATA